MRAKIDFTDVPGNVPANAVVIRDIGHSDGFSSITNDAEQVVLTVLRIVSRLGERLAPNSPPIFYYDSDGRLDQLEHDGTAFTGFKAGPEATNGG